ncbi:general transcription factor IIH subunit 1-like [Asterias rubens]|uniref:general transcription factor IIH subunit 1-like n=1 Tax=Asterias rubens TaxID=7604 RepID=UPI00145588C1|nr:general transcription factor IIH subunit 1-like [Asterias rubens]XP_033645662.1 general transcription factor IIH subunit 1-like [Asterias rubens]
MATSSEEVLLIINQVRLHKSDGSLYLMAERLAWQDDNKDYFAVSHHYRDVKQQKISQETSIKVQLQIVLHDGKSSKFHFANREGPPAQTRDRAVVKELLQQLLPKFRHMVNKELEEKNRILQDDPELFQLYKDLVISKVMTADEFWANRKSMVKPKEPSGSSNSSTVPQGVGVSAAFLSDIKPQTDGCNGVKYNLTADIIEAIFRIYPTVRKKHAENVPQNMAEKEFWTRFFQSQYFHRDRIHGSQKDIFTECANDDEKEMKEEANLTRSDPLLNIEGLSDNTLIDDGYGSKKEGPRSQATNHLINASIIKRFNHHNARVLSMSQQKGAPTTSNGLPPSIAAAANAQNHQDTSGQTAPPTKRKRLKEAIEIDDLTPKTSTTPVVLKLERTDRYYHGPTPVNQSQYSSSSEVRQAVQHVKQQLSGPQTNLTKVLASTTAGVVTNELTPGGALMGRNTAQPLHTLYTKDIHEELKHLYAALSEVLRHYWSCFPVANKSIEEKLVRMKGTLEQFQARKLQPFKDSLAKQHIGANVTIHMEELLSTAYSKFTAWQAKRAGQRS